MDSTNYNRYLAAIKAANDMSDYNRSRDTLRMIQADMIARFGLGDNDVDYLLRQFRHNI